MVEGHQEHQDSTNLTKELERLGLPLGALGVPLSVLGVLQVGEGRQLEAGSTSLNMNHPVFPLRVAEREVRWGFRIRWRVESSNTIFMTALLALLSLQQPDPLGTYIEALTAAPALSVSYVIKGRQEPENVKIHLGKPNKFHIERASELIVSDGKSLIRYLKAKNSYTKKSLAQEDLKSLFLTDALLPWGPFFESKFFASTQAKIIGTRDREGIQVRVLGIHFPGLHPRSLTLYAALEDGLARGGLIQQEEMDPLSIEVTSIAAAALDESRFIFTPPPGSADQSGI